MLKFIMMLVKNERDRRKSMINENGHSSITDYISGLSVQATPEEIKAVQPFSKILVEDYNYPKEMIITHPQLRVKAYPSDKKGYPVP